MIKAYSSVAAQTATPAELNRQVFNSIKLYLQEYKDTSRTKEDRKKAIESALVIADWVLDECMHHAETTEQLVLMYGIGRVHNLVTQASNDMSKVYDVSDAIGFTRILSE